MISGHLWALINYLFHFFLERKLSPDECPFAVYVANFSTASATCLYLKPFIFSLKLVEAMIQSDLKILDLIFYQVRIVVLEGAQQLFRLTKKVTISKRSTIFVQSS